MIKDNGYKLRLQHIGLHGNGISTNGKKDKTLALTSRITWGKHQTVEKKIKTLVSTPKASWSQYLWLPRVSTKNWENDRNQVPSIGGKIQKDSY